MSIEDQQRRSAARMRPSRWPAQGDLTPAETAEVRTLRVRVHADPGHQQARQGWQVRFFRVVQRVNPVLIRSLGVRMEIVRAREWPRASTIGDLRAALFDLVSYDPGDDIDIVIGLVAPLSSLGTVHEDLGIAQLFGRHIVMRPGDDLELYDGIARRFDRLSVDERESLFVALRRHAEATTLLHEVGHLFGGLHVDDRTSFMHARAHSQTSRFHPTNVSLMRVVVDAKRAASNETSWADRYRQILENAPPAFEPDGRARMLALVTDRTRIGAADAYDVYPRVDPGRPTGVGGVGAAPPALDADEAVVDRAVELAQKSPDAAWTLVEPVLERHPKNANYQEVGCRIALGRAPEADDTVARCTRAVELAPNAVAPYAWRAWTRLKRKEIPAALDDTRAAEARLEKLDTPSPELWSVLAQLYRGLSAVTWAEAAAERSEDPALITQVKNWGERVRKAYGLAKDAVDRGVPPEKEPDFILRRDRLAAAVATANETKIRAARRALDDAYPKMAQAAPAGAAVEAACRSAIDARRWKTAWSKCRRAAKLAPDSPQAQSMAAMAAFGVGNPGAAVAPLRRALRIAPERADIWHLLASAYRATGKRTALKRLSAQYRKRFGQALP